MYVTDWGARIHMGSRLACRELGCLEVLLFYVLFYMFCVLIIQHLEGHYSRGVHYQRWGYVG